MALNKKPVTGMKDILLAEMQLRDYCINVIKETYGKFGIYFIENTLCGIHWQLKQQAGRRKMKTDF